MSDRTRRVSRRGVLRATAGGAAASLLAGCTSPSDGGNGGNGDGTTPADGNGSVSPDDYPVVGEWLTGTEVGGADDTYDGTIVDRRGRDVVNVDVGAEGNQGYYAFGPSAVAVSTGTTVEWVWTGRGEFHNVEADPEDQVGESDYTFSSGEPVAEEGTTYSRDFGDAGVALYHCEPHLSLGMKGAVVVVA